MRQLLAICFSLLLALHSALAFRLEGLPLKTLVYDDASCTHSHHLYYIPPNFCLGPLYSPASSIKVTGAIPMGCRLVAFDDARCRGSQIATYSGETSSIKGRTARKQQVIAGPSIPNTCYGLDDDPSMKTKKQLEPKKIGANSFYLSCPVQ